MNLRLVAARVVDEVLDGHSLTDVLSTVLPTLSSPRDRAFVQAIAYGVCRFYPRLDLVLSELLTKPMKAKDSLIHALLMVGLYQLMEMRVPPHAAVAETVEAAETLKKPWAKGLINAILREYLRRQETFSKLTKEDEESLYLHPQWMISAIQKAWPADWERILQANNEQAPLSLRVNGKEINREKYLEKLTEKQINAQPILETKHGIMLDSPMSVEELPGFRHGEVSVQDGGAQLAAELLTLSPSLRVLDACAAPGGKLTHLLEREPSLSVVAVEKDSDRILSIKENLTRLNLKADVICEDAAETNRWWDGQLFDRILLDAPCSASGVIRRHPDIKLLRQPYDIKVLATMQLKLLKALWPLLKPGGLLLYVTCSIFPAENGEVMRTFFASEKSASEEKMAAEWGIACKIGRQILPGMHHMDGFYYASVRKL